MASGQTFAAYRPDPNGQWDTPLTPAELALATDIFMALRQQAQSVPPSETTPPYSSYTLQFTFDESNPPDARVVVNYDCNEWSSGYHELGVGPDLGTAWSRLSDDETTNHIMDIPLTPAVWCVPCKKYGLRTRSGGAHNHVEMCEYHFGRSVQAQNRKERKERA